MDSGSIVSNGRCNGIQEACISPDSGSELRPRFILNSCNS